MCVRTCAFTSAYIFWGQKGKGERMEGRESEERIRLTISYLLKVHTCEEYRVLSNGQWRVFAIRLDVGYPTLIATSPNSNRPIQTRNIDKPYQYNASYGFNKTRSPFPLKEKDEGGRWGARGWGKNERTCLSYRALWKRRDRQDFTEISDVFCIFRFIKNDERLTHVPIFSNNIPRSKYIALRLIRNSNRLIDSNRYQYRYLQSYFIE